MKAKVTRMNDFVQIHDPSGQTFLMDITSAAELAIDMMVMVNLIDDDRREEDESE